MLTTTEILNILILVFTILLVLLSTTIIYLFLMVIRQKQTIKNVLKST